jgi:predicted RND superfamily exporter protein
LVVLAERTASTDDPAAKLLAHLYFFHERANMKTETLHIVGSVSAEAAERAAARLKAIPGVHDVSFLDSPARLFARIDDKTTTRTQLVAALAEAGVLVEAPQSPHANGSCCGGCGS